MENTFFTVENVTDWLRVWYPLILLAILILILCSRKLTIKIAAVIFRIFLFRLRVIGKENIANSGPIILVANHVSLLDLLMIQSVIRQRVRFMVREEIAKFLPTRFLYRYLGVLSVPRSQKITSMKKFLSEVHGCLRAGETLCFFPEGAISGNGDLMRFRSGVKVLIPPEIQVTVIPLRLGMVHGRMTGIYQNRLYFRKLTRWPVDYSIAIGQPVDPGMSAFQLRQAVSELGAIAEASPQPGEKPIHTSFIYYAKRHPFGRVFHDTASRQWIGNFKMLLLIIMLSRKLREIESGTAGYTGVLLPNTPILAGVLLSIQSADRVPAVMNYSVGEQVALASIRNAGVRTILTSRKFLEKLHWEASPEMVFLEDLVPSISKKEKLTAVFMAACLPTRTLVRNIAPLSCYNMFQQAVLLFSSGSTGKPKGVMLTQRNISCDILSLLRVLDWSQADRVAGNLPIFHSFGFTVCFALSALTGTPVAYSANPLDAATVLESIRRIGVTIFVATPTFLQKYLMKAKAEDFKTVRLCVTGAEKLRTELAERYRNMTGRDITEGYGCTELSPIVTVNINKSIYTLGSVTDHPGSIGCPLPGIHARIVDISSGVELPPGKDGLLQIRSGTIMKGYLDEPDLTATVIQNHYYNTGDIGHMDEDGYIYITGRASRFSKIGGEMVPHEGLEDAITKILHSETREIAVASRPDKNKGERLVVFYTPDSFSVPEVITGLKEAGLPNIWIPKAEDFIKVDHLPILGSGKLHLIKLKEMVEQYCQ